MTRRRDRRERLALNKRTRELRLQLKRSHAVQYYGRDGRDGREIDLARWAAILETPKAGLRLRQVAHTRLANNVWVSTVCDGLDHAYGMTRQPLIFETMVFVGAGTSKPLHSLTTRYSTLAEARAGHQVAVRRAQIHLAAEPTAIDAGVE